MSPESIYHRLASSALPGTPLGKWLKRNHGAVVRAVGRAGVPDRTHEIAAEARAATDAGLVRLIDLALKAKRTPPQPYLAERTRRVDAYEAELNKLTDADLADWYSLRLMKRQPWPGGDYVLPSEAWARAVTARGVFPAEFTATGLNRAAEQLAERARVAAIEEHERARPRSPTEQAKEALVARIRELRAWGEGQPKWVLAMLRLPDEADIAKWSGYRTKADYEEMLAKLEEDYKEAEFFAGKVKSTSKVTPESRFEAALDAVASEMATRKMLSIEGVSGVHAAALRRLEAEGDKEALDVGRGNKDDLVSAVMVRHGAVPAWRMTFAEFLKRPNAVLVPGLAPRSDTPFASEAAEAAAKAAVAAAKERVKQTKEGREWLGLRSSSYRGFVADPEGKTALAAAKALVEAERAEVDTRKRWHDHDQWEVWMRARRHARNMGLPVPAVDEREPPQPGPFLPASVATDPTALGIQQLKAATSPAEVSAALRLLDIEQDTLAVHEGLRVLSILGVPEARRRAAWKAATASNYEHKYADVHDLLREAARLRKASAAAGSDRAVRAALLKRAAAHPDLRARLEAAKSAEVGEVERARAYEALGKSGAAASWRGKNARALAQRAASQRRAVEDSVIAEVKRREPPRPNPARNPRISAQRTHLTPADYPGVFRDAGHGIPAVDDPWPDEPCPRDAHCPDTVEEVRLSDELRALLKIRDEFEGVRRDLVHRIEDKLKLPAGAVKSRTKTPYSILNKLRRKRIFGPHGLTDIVGAMMLAKNQAELDRLHSRIEGGVLGPVVEREDYYAKPLNGYRAYHFIVDVHGHLVEVQLKTKRQAALAGASHEAYKRGVLDATAMEKLTALAARADAGDTKAAAVIDPLLADPAALEHRMERR